MDHGQDSAFIKKAIDLGFNSVMIDASLDSFDDNVKKTREIVDYARARGVAVEAEIGFVGANANQENHRVTDSIYTSLEDAKLFTNKHWLMPCRSQLERHTVFIEDSSSSTLSA